MERTLAAIDFSRFSKVRDSLLQQLKEQHTVQNKRKSDDELSMEELDMIAAARNIERSDNKWKK